MRGARSGDAIALIALAVTACACGSGDGPARPLIDAPFAPFPKRLRDTGLYVDPAERSGVHPRTRRYAPKWPLWSNGSVKTRYVAVPEGARIDIQDRDAWRFPEGTLFFKTFAFVGADGEARPVETRIIRVRGDEVDYGAYRWNDAASRARRLDMDDPVAVTVVGPDGGAFEHVIPSRFQCRQCHESNIEPIIGFDELQLGGDDLERLSMLFASGDPHEPRRIEARDRRTREVMGYARGNCVHCHNGRGGPSGSFDMRPDVFVENTVNAETQSAGTEAGIRVVPGSPSDSILFLSLTGETAGREIKDMPPVGVQRRDTEAIALFREWIIGLESSGDG